MTGGGLDYTFECIGNVDAMRQAMDACHIGWGESCVIGVDGNEFTGHPYHLLYRENLEGHYVWGSSRDGTDVPKIVLVHGRKN